MVKIMIDKKKRHIDIVLNKQVDENSAGFENYKFTHNALPEIDFNEVKTSYSFIGKKLRAPILIAPMTGGTSQAMVINTNLAKAAEKCGIALGLGSMRIAIEVQNKVKSQENDFILKSFKVRKYCKNMPLFADLGAVQLNYGFGAEECRKAVEMIEADGLILHLNPMQEVIQSRIKNPLQGKQESRINLPILLPPVSLGVNEVNNLEGNVDFRGLLGKIEDVCKKVNFPVFVGEVGFGISFDVAKKLFSVGVSGILTGGWGGTNWAKIAGEESENSLGETFSNWGISTTDSIIQCKEALRVSSWSPEATSNDKRPVIIATGGIRSGLDAAKALVLGADLIGVALPLLKPALESEEAVSLKIEQYILELKMAMFGVGAGSVEELKKQKLINLDKTVCF